MSESPVDAEGTTVTTRTPAPTAAARVRLTAERVTLQARLQSLVVRGDEMTGPGDAVDHAQSVSRQIEQEHLQGQLNQIDLLLSLPVADTVAVPEGGDRGRLHRPARVRRR